MMTSFVRALWYGADSERTQVASCGLTPGRRLGYDRSNSSITFSMPLTTSVKRS